MNDLNPEDEFLLAVITYLRRIRREQLTQPWLREQFLSLNHKVDLAMSQQHDDALAIMAKLKADTATLLAAIQSSSNPPTPEDWSDVIAAAQEIDGTVTAATPAAPAA